MTSLGAQLKELSLKNAFATNLATLKHRPTLLYADTPKLAQDRDRDEVFAIALNGLLELIQLDPRFVQFQSNLFSEQLKAYDRTLKTVEENLKLDQRISDFLAMVSPHMLLKPAVKCLEWLIYRFQISDFNVEPLVACVMPYHETAQFVRVCKLFRKGQDLGRFSFLHQVALHQVPLDRASLVHQCRKQPALVDWICQMLKAAVELDTISTVLVSFVTATLAAYLHLFPRVSEDLVLRLVPFLLAFARQEKDLNVQLCAYMILTMMSHKVALSETASSQLVAVIVQHALDASNAWLVVLKLVQNQETLTALPEPSIKAITSRPEEFMKLLLQWRSEFDTERFEQLLFSGLLTLQQWSVMDLYIKNADFRFLSSTLKPICLHILNKLMVEEDSSVKAQLESLLHHIYTRNAPALDEIISTKLNDLGTNGQECDKMYAILSKSFSGTRSEWIKDAETTLSLGLIHPVENVRLLATKHLLSAYKTYTDKEFVQQSLLAGLRDDSELVALEILNQSYQCGVLIDSCDSQALLDALIVISEKEGIPSLLRQSAFKVLLNDKLYSKHQEKIDEVLLSTLFFPIDNVQPYLEVIKAVTFKPLSGLLAYLPSRLHKVQAAHDIVVVLADIAKQDENMLSLLSKETDSKSFAVSAISTLSLVHYLKTTGGTDSKFKTLMMNLIPSSMNINVLVKLDDKMQMVNENGSISDECLSYLLAHGKATCKRAVLALAVLSQLVPIVPSLDPKCTVWLVDDVGTNESNCELVLKTFAAISKSIQLPAVQSLLPIFIENVFRPSNKASGNATCLISFLAHVLISSQDTDMRLVALNLIATMVQISCANGTKDFQILIPILTCLLVDDKVDIRRLAVSLLNSLRETSSSFVKSSAFESKKNRKSAVGNAIIASEIFYGPQTGSHVLFLSPNDCSNFLMDLKKASESAVADPQIVRSFFGRYFFKKGSENADSKSRHQREMYLGALLSHLKACHYTPFRTSLLRVFELVDNKIMVKSAAVVIEDIFESGYTTGLAALPYTKVALLKSAIRCFREAYASQFDKKGFVALKLLEEFSGIEASDSFVGDVLDELLNTIKPLYSLMSSQAKSSLLTSLIFNYLVHSKNAKLTASVRLILSEFVILPEIISNILKATIDELVEISEGEEQNNATRRKLMETIGYSESLSLISKKIIAVLEVCTANNSISSDVNLINVLFELLGSWSSIDESIKSRLVALEYGKQLALGLLANIFDKIDPQLANAVETFDIRVDLLAQTIRLSQNPLTQNHVLKLLASIASVFPDKVVCAVMPIFTFMGANVLRQDDDYSFFVIKETLKNVIPPLMKCSSNMEAQFTPIIQTFSTAFYHIPHHRRMVLFELLVRTIGAEEVLHHVVCKLLSTYHSDSDRSVSVRKEEAVHTFCCNLFNAFDASTQLRSMVSILSLATISISRNEIGNDGAQSFVLTEFVANQLSNRKFLHKLESMGPGKEPRIEELFMELIEISLREFSLVQERLRAEKQCPSSENILRAVFDVLERVNGLLPIAKFVNIITRLFSHQEPSVRRKAILIFNGRLQRTDGTELEANVVDLLEAIQPCQSVIQNSVETPLNKQNALLSLGLLCKLFGQKRAEVFIPTCETIISQHALMNESQEIKTSSMATVAVYIDVLGPQMLPKLSEVMSVVIESMRCQTAEDVFAHGPLAVVCSTFEKLPQFIGPYIDPILKKVFSPSYLGLFDDLAEVQGLIDRILTAVSQKVAPRILLPIIAKSYDTCVDMGHEAVCSLFDLLGKAISVMTKNHVHSNYKLLFKFFLTSFDLRVSDKHFSDSDQDLVDRSMIAAFALLVVKLNETMFKPLFMKMIEWSITETDQDAEKTTYSRSLILYRTLDTLLHNLKSVISPYGIFVLDNAITLLDSYAHSKKWDQRWSWLMGCMTKIFLYDHDAMLSEKQLQSLIQPLVNQLKVTDKDRTVCVKRVRTYISPCLVQLAVLAQRAEPLLLKRLNQAVLMQTRNEQANARYGALLAVQEFYSRMGNEFLVHLPETVPYLAELLEDDDEEVEHLCREVIAVVEEYLGESLDEHMK